MVFSGDHDAMLADRRHVAMLVLMLLPTTVVMPLATTKVFEATRLGSMALVEASTTSAALHEVVRRRRYTPRGLSEV